MILFDISTNEPTSAYNDYLNLVIVEQTSTGNSENSFSWMRKNIEFHTCTPDDIENYFTATPYGIPKENYAFFM